MRVNILLSLVFIIATPLLTFQTTLIPDCEGTCPCGKSPNVVNITEVCERFPGWDSECCSCIVAHASHGDSHAGKDKEDGSIDVGLWQINSMMWKQCAGGSAPCAVQANMNCAVEMWKRAGGSFKAWPSLSKACPCTKSTLPNSFPTNNNYKIKPKIFFDSNKQPQLNVSGSNCGGNCPGGNCGSCPCGTSPSKQDISTWCSKFSGWDQTCCNCIVSHESGGNANAVNENTNGSFDIGLWQINSVNWGSCAGGSAPCDSNTNLKCAQVVWKNGGNSFKQWSTCSACGCCSPTTGGTTGASGPSSSSTRTAGPASSSSTTDGPASSSSTKTSSSSTRTSSATESSYSTAFYDAKKNNGGDGNAPLPNSFSNVIYEKKKSKF